MFIPKPNTPTLRFSGIRSPACSRVSRRRAFTLIELLMVITVILILAGITFGISRGVQNAQARAKAKAELANISQALEQFKSVNGDYPWNQSNPSPTRSTDEENGKQLLRALAGYMKFNTGGATTQFVRKGTADIPTNGPQSFIDLTRVSMNQPASALPSGVATVPENFYFVDPWGNPYVYRYKASATDSWERFGFVLFSTGPDGQKGTPIPNTGIIPPEDGNVEAVDNIYSGE